MSSQETVKLLSLGGDQAGDVAEPVYQYLVSRINQASSSIELHMYVWRADAVGHFVGEAILDAANRGVKIKILKDQGAALYESQESNRKPFFPTPRTWLKRMTHWGLGLTFPRSFIQDHWTQDLGREILAHPNVEFEWVSPTHTKYYCIDEACLITGSLNLEERHRKYHDIMVELRGRGSVDAFRKAQVSPSRESLTPSGVRILMNDAEVGVFAIKPFVLDVVNSAEETIYLEMAYMGDDDVSEALVSATRRGVRVRILFSKKSNIGNDVNYHVLRHLMLSADVEVRLSPKMIHSKLIFIDERSVMLGSANFSIFSMQRAGELNLLIEDMPLFFEDLTEVLQARWELGVPVGSAQQLPHYWKSLARLQQWYQRTSQHR